MPKPQHGGRTPSPQNMAPPTAEQGAGANAEVPASVAMAAKRARMALAAMAAGAEGPVSHGSRAQPRHYRRGR